MDQRPLALRPHDVVVALQLVLTPRASYPELADLVGLSVGESHNSVRRLRAAHLVLPGRSKRVNKRALVEFLLHGVPYAYPGQLGPVTRGVPTAHAGPALWERFRAPDVVVWPSPKGNARGESIVPLCPRAADLEQTNPALYRWLTLVDALRIGRSRERSIASQILEQEIQEGEAEWVQNPAPTDTSWN